MAPQQNRVKDRPQFPDFNCETERDQDAYLTGMYMGAELVVLMAASMGAPDGILNALQRTYVVIDRLADATKETAEPEIPKLPDIPTNPNNEA